MRDCRYYDKGCTLEQNETRYCPYEKDDRFRCLWYEGKNE